MWFNPRSAKLMKPGEHLLVEGCPGLRLVCNATRKTWTYRYEIDGKMKQKALGQWPGMQLHDAVGEWSDLRTTAPDRRHTAKEAAKTYTIQEMISDFSAEHLQARRTKDSFRAASKMLETVALEIGDLKAVEVTRNDAYDVLTARKETPTVASKVRSLMASATDHALDAGRIPGDVANHWIGLMRGKLKSKGKIVGGQHVGRQRRALSQAEVGALLRWIDAMHPLGRDCTIMYLWTCSRGGEFLWMRKEHVTEEKDGLWFTLPKMLTKNRNHDFAVDYRTPLYGEALNVVRRRMESVGESGWLFEDRRKEQYTQHDFSTYVYSLMPYSVKRGALKCPVSNWTPHNLRRTSRTLLAALGCPKEIGEAILGHLPREIEATYNVHTYDAEKVEWLSKLSSLLYRLRNSPEA